MCIKKDKEMKRFYRDFLATNLYFWVFGLIATALIITSFFIPPLAVIDGSVIASVGELFAFAALGAVIHAIDKGKTASVTHGGTTVSIGDDNNDD